MTLPAVLEIPPKGSYVVRGPRWEGGTEDGGLGVVGVVSAADEEEGTVTVIWPNSRNCTYRLADREIALASPSQFEPWAPVEESRVAIGAQVRRGAQWLRGNEDGGAPGTILDINGTKLTVEWASGMIGEYKIDGTQLLIRADRSGIEQVLVEIWEEELSNALKLMQREQQVMFESMRRQNAASTDSEREDAVAEMLAAQEVLAEAESMYKMVEQHLAESLSHGDVQAPGVVVDNMAKKKLRDCEREVATTEELFQQILSPDGALRLKAYPSVQQTWITLHLSDLNRFGGEAQPPTSSPGYALRARPDVVDGAQYSSDFRSFGGYNAKIGAPDAAMLHKCLVTEPHRKRLVLALQMQAGRSHTAN
jgi:hypothetical protein